jgi:hypothetical protein
LEPWGFWQPVLCPTMSTRQSGASDQVLLAAAVSWCCCYVECRGIVALCVCQLVRRASGMYRRQCGPRGLVLQRLAVFIHVPRADYVSRVDHSRACWLRAVAVSEHVCKSLSGSCLSHPAAFASTHRLRVHALSAGTQGVARRARWSATVVDTAARHARVDGVSLGCL